MNNIDKNINNMNDNKINNNYMNNPLSDSNYLSNNTIQDSLNFQPNSIQISPVPFSSNMNSNVISNNNRNNQEPIPNVNIPNLIPQFKYNDIQIKEPFSKNENIINSNNLTPLNNIISSIPLDNTDKGININQQSNDFLKSNNI